MKAREWIEAVVIQRVVVADVKRRAGIGRPSQQVLPAHARIKRVIIESHTNECETRELVGCSQRSYIVYENGSPRFIARESVSSILNRSVKRIGKFV